MSDIRENPTDRAKEMFDLDRECDLDGCMHPPATGGAYCCIEHEKEDMELPIPYYVIASAVENQKEHDEYAVVRSDNDYQYARNIGEANVLASEMRSETTYIDTLEHTVQIIDLQEEPPDA